MPAPLYNIIDMMIILPASLFRRHAPPHHSFIRQTAFRDTSPVNAAEALKRTTTYRSTINFTRPSVFYEVQFIAHSPPPTFRR